MTKKIKFPQYFKTKEGIFCHTLSENCYFDNNLIIGLPKYFPTNHPIETGRIIEGGSYLDHMPSFHHSIERTRMLYGQYMKYIPFFGEELCVFDIQKDIVDIYDPINVAQMIYSKIFSKDTEKIYYDANRLLNIIIKHFDIPLEDIGIEGSIMLNCFNKKSDIDVVIYGSASVEKLLNKFHDLNNYPEIHLYDMSDIDLIFSRRYKYKSFDSNEELLMQEKQRTVGLINNRRFWLQPIFGSDKIERSFKERTVSKIDIIEDAFDVVDSSHACFWPSFYTLKNEKFGVVHLECYDPIYMNQARKGDKVIIRGNLYIETSGEDSQLKKKLIILGPWITTTQFVRKM